MTYKTTTNNRYFFSCGVLALLTVTCWIGKAASAADAVPAPAAPSVAPAPEGVTIPTKDLMSIIRDGGPMMYPIALSSIIMVAFVLERAISLRRGRVIPRPFVKRFVQQLRDGELDRDQALALCEENGSPVARVLAGAVRKWGRPSVEVEQGVIDSGERVAAGLRKYLRVLGAVAAISPMLGLLGTVTGMIRAFNVIAAADALGRPQLLASGISEALLTTAAGLFVAIPAMAFSMIFVSRVDRLIVEIDALGQEVVNTISAEELQERKTRSPKTRRAAEMKPAA
ncbi:MAG: MotA/TolQ/ExbB proton channel family protein [Pirellulales bacterium]|nr:MotA/TolQ/ExbB proton channel family protein [Pirellulales bacterium]